VAAQRETSVTMETAADPPVICVGDLHGHIEKAKQLWAALQSELGVTTVNAARVVFLGDYVDRGPNSREVLDWLIELEESRAPGTTVFLAGNHDFAFGCFLGCLDVVPTGFDLDGTRNPSYTSGYWTPPVEGGMHYQGRRWGGDGNADIYDAKITFKSYGVQYAHTAEARDALVAAVPQAHKDFLRRLLWVYDAPVSFAPGRLVCVHAGLLTDGSLEEQLAGLHAKNLEARALQVGGYGRFEAFSGRAEVERMHPELVGRALLVSGHHGYTQQSGDRLIVDTSGGRYGDENPIEAVVLPCRRLVSSSSRPGSWSRDPPVRKLTQLQKDHAREQGQDEEEMGDDVFALLQGLKLPEYAEAFATERWTMAGLKVRAHSQTSHRYIRTSSSSCPLVYSTVLQLMAWSACPSRLCNQIS
jgi:hypothetical protein